MASDASVISTAPPLSGNLRFRLSLMMFLEFFIWGAWLPVSFGLFPAMGFDETQQSLLHICFPISAILAMFFGNQFVDRNFAAEKFLALSHLLGGGALLAFGALAWQSFQPDAAPANFYIFLALMAVHCLFYVPTISVTNTLAFANVNDPQRDFGTLRLFGTIGWILASWPFVFILVDWAKVPDMAAAGGVIGWLGKALGTPLEGRALSQGTSWAFMTGGLGALLLGVFSFSLPHTPPKKIHEPGKSLAWVEAFSYLKKPFLLVLFFTTWIDATVHDGFFYYANSYLQHVGVPSNWTQVAMSVGQIAEILTMYSLGYVLSKLGWRYTMIIGILGHTLRFGLWALAPNPYVAVSMNLAHGICYAFYFATLYILVDEYFPKDARTSAQGLFNFLILGMGPLTSRLVWGRLQALFTTGDTIENKVVNWSQLLLVPAGAAFFAAILLLLFFHPPKSSGSIKVSH
ncbi:nucleoside:H symporter [Planctopirus limnophila DSM 3776]|uniref:Nucleoside:H symporter n=1 Tax=Planctopirus limnophila (strain ATCC 43296 / DSM 3776 / IFAM 1008 / Mu 290) TaxID=521674 RepID=D5SS49_PLAL2|nr:MFS transporter [Planctopirus limnophila]ADG68773.1 nucleoside:H symporter [Planctopirus limnophila DSM 3776]